MKSRKKQKLPIRAKRYRDKAGKNFDYNNLEPRQLLAADLGQFPTVAAANDMVELINPAMLTTQQDTSVNGDYADENYPTLDVSMLPTVNYIGTTDLLVFDEPISKADGITMLREHLGLGENESIKLQKSWSDAYGFEHRKYQQYFNGHRVQGSSYSIHMKDSMIVSFSGDRVALENPVSDISLSNEQAYAVASEYIGASMYAWQDPILAEIIGLDEGPAGEIVYVTDADGSSVPTYKFDMYALDLGTRDYVYVNANSGAIEAVETRMRYADVAATGTTHYNGTQDFLADEFATNAFRLQQTTNGVITFDNQTGAVGDFTNAIDITASSPTFDSPNATSGVSAHWGAENMLSLLTDWFGRDSYDDAGATLTSYVNVSNNLVNAFWNGSVMQYGEGDGVDFGPLVSLDVVGHEIAHGVTQFSADLVYAGEPGALNESYSDIFGELLEYYTTGTNDWLVGDQLHFAGDGIRNFMVPNSDGQPDTYLGDMWGFGVHTNSGVQNKWFHILSEGEVGTNDNGDDYDVTGIGIEDAAQIAYRALNTYLSVNSQYQDARAAGVQSAEDIFGKNSPQHKATKDAWEAVGVYSEDVVVETVDEVFPGSMIYASSVVDTIPDIGSRNLVIELDAGQTLSVIVDADPGVTPSIDVYDSAGTLLASGTTTGVRAMVNVVPIATAGEYTIEVDSTSAINGGFEAQIVLNASMEDELVTSVDNGSLAQAQDIMSSSLSLSPFAAERMGAFGEFEIREIPFFAGENFESGGFGSGWTTTSSQAEGRIQILDSLATGEGSFGMFMDTTGTGFSNLNEAIWSVDLSTRSNPFLNFYYASYDDENDVLPASFNGTFNGDGVSVSDDGITWHTILTDSVTDSGDWKQISINLGDLADTVGLQLTQDFQVKFQQYDDDMLGSDGRAYDGISITETEKSEDWYQVDLTAGDVATFAVGQLGDAGYVDLELYDSSGNLLQTGASNSESDGYISQFVADQTDAYFARLVGSVTSYGLVVTRGADFDTGSGSTTPQDITLVGNVVGYVDTVSKGDADPDAASDRQVLDNFFDGMTLSNNITGGSVYAVRTSFDAPSGLHVFAPSPTDGSGWQAGVNELRADFAIPQTEVTILVGAEESETDMGVIRAYDVEGVEIDEAFSRPLNPGETQVVRVNSPTRQIAYIVASGFQNDVTPLDTIGYEVPQEAADYYSVEVVANQMLDVTATLPGSGQYLFNNGLVDGGIIQFQMELIDPSGVVVASGTESMTYFAETPGTYKIRASAAAGEGNYVLGMQTEVQEDRFSLGNLGSGVAMDDAYEGKGYLLYSVENLFTRFPSNRPFYQNAEHVIAVRYNAALQTWEYNDNNFPSSPSGGWNAFTAAEGDRLLAVVDFTAEQVNSLEGLTGSVHGIPVGFVSSDIDFTANTWNGSSNSGEFDVSGSYFRTGDEWTSVGAANYGVAADDSYQGTGYLMYSEEVVQTRFAADAPYENNATNVMSVRYNLSTLTWEYSNNFDWVAFTPVATDRLLARVDHQADIVTSLEGKSGVVFGIKEGFIASDIEFYANQWNGASNAGEFDFTGSEFLTKDDYFELGNVGSGVAVHDGASGTGQIMYSNENVFTRFAGGNAPAAGNAEHLIAVRFDSGTSSWQYSDDNGWVGFVAEDSDRLVANLDFDSDSATPIVGVGGRVNGMVQGFFNSDMSIVANSWGGGVDDGEFEIFGTYFSTGSYSYGVENLGNGIAVDDAATGTGFVMYSEQNLNNRFASDKPFWQSASNFIAVRFNAGNWEYSDNFNWHVFTIAANDRLVAALDFDADSITSLVGTTGSYEGISQGFFDSDLTFVANSWGGSSNAGEFEVYGTSFIA